MLYLVVVPEKYYRLPCGLIEKGKEEEPIHLRREYSLTSAQIAFMNSFIKKHRSDSAAHREIIDNHRKRIECLDHVVCFTVTGLEGRGFWRDRIEFPSENALKGDWPIEIGVRAF